MKEPVKMTFSHNGLKVDFDFASYEWAFLVNFVNNVQMQEKRNPIPAAESKPVKLVGGNTVFDRNKEVVIKKLKEGKTLTAIAALVHGDVGGLSKWVKKNNLASLRDIAAAPRTAPRKYHSKATKHLNAIRTSIKRKLRDGKKVADIAACYGVSIVTVYNWLKKNHISTKG